MVRLFVDYHVMLDRAKPRYFLLIGSFLCLLSLSFSSCVICGNTNITRYRVKQPVTINKTSTTNFIPYMYIDQEDMSLDYFMPYQTS